MSKYQWNPLIDEKEFEDLVNELCCKKYNLQDFQLYGRKGQKQYGIDGFVVTEDKHLIVHQCKNKMISRKDSEIKKELLKDIECETEVMVKEFIEKKKYKVKTFIFANSFKQDTQLQDKAIELSTKYKFDIIIWSWDIISNMLEEYSDIAQKYYPDFFKDKIETKPIISLSNEKYFLEDIFLKIQANKPIMILSITSSATHYQVLKYYKKRIQKEMLTLFSTENIISFDLIDTKTEKKFFQYITNRKDFEEVVQTSYEFVELINNKLECDDILLIINNFENAKEEHLRKLADGIHKLWEDSHNNSFNIIIFGKKKLLSLKLINGSLSPLTMFKEVWLTTPSIDDYKKILGVSYDIEEIYNLVGGNPELLEFCTDNYPQKDYKNFLLNSEYLAKFFEKYYTKKDKLFKIFDQDSFGNYHAFSHEELYRDLFWDNLIVKSDNGKFKWIAPIVVEMGKRYFLC